MALIKEIDYGTPIRVADKTVTADDRRPERHGARRHLVMAAAMHAGTQIPKLCATDSLEPFGSCRLCLVEIDGSGGAPPSCTTPAEDGMVVHTQSDKLHRLRKGVMELYISDHPLDCLTCAANGDCELQDMAAPSPARGALQRGREPRPQVVRPLPAEGRSNPYFTYDPPSASSAIAACGLRGVLHHFALTIAAGFDSRSRRPTNFMTPSACPAAPACRPADRDPDREVVIAMGQPEHSAVTTCAYCGVGCAFKAEMQRARGGDGALQGREGQRHSSASRPLRLRLRHPQGPHHQADDPGQDHGSVARGDLGRGDRTARPRSSSASRRGTARRDRRHHLVALHQRGGYLVQKLVRAAFGNNNVDTCPGSAIRRPVTA